MDKTDITEISAIIVAQGKPVLTEQCIRLLREALAEFHHEIILVEDGPGDGSLQGYEDIRRIRNENQLGLAASWNRGMKSAAGNILLLLHNSILVTKQALGTMLEILLSRQDIGAVGPLTNKCHYSMQQGIIVKDEVNSISSLHKLVRQIENMKVPTDPVFFLEDFCILLRGSAAEAVGDFDGSFLSAGFEDADYGLRLRRAGYSLLRSGTYVHNCGGMYMYDDTSWERNRNLFFEKWGVIPAYSLMVRLDILKHIDKDRENLSVLDVGCACGTNLMWLKYYNPKARLQGIELNEKSAAIARWFGDIEAMDVETLEREEWKESFDYIILADILEHLRDPWSFLEKVRGFLKPDGRVILSVPNVCHVSNLWDMLHGDWEYQEEGILDRTHLRFFTRKSFMKYLEEAGLSIISTEPNPLIGEHHKRLMEGLLALEDTELSREELTALQWIFVVTKEGSVHHHEH